MIQEGHAQLLKLRYLFLKLIQCAFWVKMAKMMDFKNFSRIVKIVHSATNSFFFFLCFLNCSIIFFLEKRFLVSFLPETADHKLPDTIAEGEAMGQGDTLWKCFKKRSKANSVQGKRYTSS